MRRLARIASVVAAILLGLVLLRPVIFAPITGDDTFYDFSAAAMAHGAIGSEYLDLHAEWDRRVNKGRVNVLTGVERKVTGRAVLDSAVATGHQPREVQSLFRIFFLGLCMAAVYVLLRALRWRRRDSGELVRLGVRARTIALTAGGLVFAAGAQPQLVGLHGWNGWLSYPVSTLTAPLSIFGVAALALWLARLSVVRGWRFGIPAALVLLVVGALTNYRYELTFVALPVVVIALLLVPVSSRAERPAGRRVKTFLGAAYVVGFLPVLIANRIMLNHICAHQECYQGVRPAADVGMLTTFAANVLSNIPGVGRAKTDEFLRSQDVSTHGLWSPTVWSILLALLLLAVLALAWWGGGAPKEEPAPDAEEARAQGVLCVVGAVILVAGGLGTAGVMSLSRASQEHTSQLGLLFRNAPTTWLGFAFGLALVVVAAGLVRPRFALPTLVALGVAVALLVTVKVPADLRVAKANNSFMRASNQVFSEMVRGQQGEAADQRRCALIHQVRRDMSPLYFKLIRRTSQQAFEHYWHAPFCSQE
jgi:hypothetical protein